MNSNLELWASVFGFSEKMPRWFLAALVFFIGYFFVALPAAAILVGLERKFTASVQARIGPSLVGPRGAFQSIADFIKLLQKSKHTGRFSSEDFWLLFIYSSFFSILGVLPLCSFWIVVDSEMSAFLPILISIILAFASLMFGIEQGTVYSFFGGVRLAARVVASALPAIVSILCVGLRSGSFQWKAIVEMQGALPQDWNIFSDPFQWLAFFVFFCSGPMLFGFQSSGTASVENDLNGGIIARFYGIRLTLFKVKEVYCLFLWSALSSILFFGAWQIPASVRDGLVQSQAWNWVALIEFTVLAAKSMALVFIYYWISTSNPRLRSDQLTDFSWKVLSPVSIFTLLGSSLWLVWKGGAQ